MKWLTIKDKRINKGSHILNFFCVVIVTCSFTSSSHSSVEINKIVDRSMDS